MATNLAIRKAYVIIHDGKRVLLGKGGTSGKTKTARQGGHLPGGSFEVNANENSMAVAIRETQQETGIKLEPDNFTDKSFCRVFVVPTKSGTHKLNFDIDFLLYKVAPKALEELSQQSLPDDKSNGKDSPFTSLITIPIDSRIGTDTAMFSSGFGTDWFGDGLQAAYANHKFS